MYGSREISRRTESVTQENLLFTMNINFLSCVILKFAHISVRRYTKTAVGVVYGSRCNIRLLFFVNSRKNNF